MFPASLLPFVLLLLNIAKPPSAQTQFPQAQHPLGQAKSWLSTQKSWVLLEDSPASFRSSFSVSSSSLRV